MKHVECMTIVSIAQQVDMPSHHCCCGAQTNSSLLRLCAGLAESRTLQRSSSLGFA